MRTVKRTLCVLFVLAAAGCAEASIDYDYNLPPITMESDYVTLGMQNETEICPSFLERLDAYIERVRELWNLSPDGAKKIPVYILDDSRTEEFCNDKSDSGVAGCFIHHRDIAFVVVKEHQISSVYHELTHAILDMEAKIPNVLFFIEGMAEAFGDGGCDQNNQGEILSLETVYNEVNTSEARTVLQDFFKYLYGQYGAEPLLSWGHRLHPASNLDEVSATFEAVFGLSLTDAWQAERPPFAVPSFSMCLAETSPWQDEETWEYRFDTCSSSLSYNNYGFWKEEAIIEITEEDLYRFDFSSTGQGVYLHSCDVCGGENGSRAASKHVLSPGRYAVQLYADSEIERPVDVLVEPYVQCDPFGDDCIENERCNDFGAGGGIVCAALNEPPVEIGERCEAPEDGEVDPCVQGASCVAGLCRSLCEGTLEAPHCPDGEACFKEVASNLYPGVCMKICSRLAANDCAEDEFCRSVEYEDTETAVCAVYDGETLAIGESCDLLQIEAMTPFTVSEYSKCVSSALCVNGECAQKCDPLDDTSPCSSAAECTAISTDSEESNETYGLCLTSCDPLAPECPDGASCVQSYAESSEYRCSAHSPVDDFSDYGEDACLFFECGEGLYCTSLETAVPNADISLGFGVCTALCDPSAEDPDAQCPDASLGQTCREIEDNSKLGFCAVD